MGAAGVVAHAGGAGLDATAPGVLAHAGGAGFDEWLYLLVPVGFYAASTVGLLAAGRSAASGTPLDVFVGRVADALRRLTGVAGWASAGTLTGLLVLLVAVVGFYWDVAWHIDHGRDEQLFTPAHVMILVGLAGLVHTAVTAAVFATVQQAPVGLHLRRVRLPGVTTPGVRVPYSALLLAVLGAGAVAAFPLDELWHRAYGIDVTLWSPTHLQLVTGGSLATLALWLMLAEAGADSAPNAFGRGIHALVAGAALVGMSTFQAEFDYGVPQFQALYLPLLVAAAGAFVLVAARVALGPGGAVKAVAFYLLLRGGLALVVGGALNHTVPRFPLYLPTALAVEVAAAAVGTGRRLRFALAAGALAATAGMAGELVWLDLTSWHGVPTVVLPAAAAGGVVAAVAAAVLGGGLARAFSPAGRVPAPVLLTAGAALVAVLAYPLPRQVGDVAATVDLQRVGDHAWVEVALAPPDAARRAAGFSVTSWQGGGTSFAALREVAPGRYRSDRPVPVTGSWKTMLSLQRGAEVMAAPLYLPADPAIGAPEVPAVAQRRVRFVRNTDVLLREVHDGPGWPALVAYTGLAALVAVWVGLIAVAARRVRAAAVAAEEVRRALIP